MTLQVDRDHGVPLAFGHVHQHAVAEDSGVVDQDVEAAEVVDRLCDHPFRAGEVGHVLVVRGSLAPGGSDLVDDLLRGRCVVTLAGELAAEVVDDHRRARGGERERVRAADAAAGAGDDRDLAREVGHRAREYVCLPAAAMSWCQTPFGSRTTLVTARCSLFVRLEEAR